MQSNAYDHAVRLVIERWGVNVQELVGAEIFEALVAREILIIACAQDRSITPHRIVTVINEARQVQIETMHASRCIHDLV